MTAIYYPDLVAWSPGRRFRLEAVSPYNLPEWHPDRKVSPLQLVWPDAFQEEFEFTLYEGDSDRALWAVPQSQASEISPHELYVSDRGSCVVRTHGPFSAGLVVLGERGARIASFDLLETVFVGAWSAGGRILIELERGRRVDDGPYEAELATIERSWALAKLRFGAEPVASFEEFPEDADDVRLVSDVGTAAALAGRLGLVEAEAPLRTLETTPFMTNHTFVNELFRGPRSDLGVSWRISWRAVRVLAAQALRRLQRPPRGFASHSFDQVIGEDTVALELPEFLRDRDDRLARLSSGMSALQVLERAGAPDYLDNAATWDYDLTNDESIRLRLDRKTGLLSAIDRLRPAGWQGEDREHDVLG